MNLWEQILERVRRELDPEEFRRWFATTTYASDSGDQITVWVDSEPSRRHIVAHYQFHIDRALAALHRSDTDVRFVVAGYGDDDDQG